jgi:phosphoadenosine phosphosulfate reductase
VKDLLTKTQQAKEIVKDTFSRAKVPFVEFTGGNDSLVVLHLVKELRHKPVSVLFIDTTAHFQELYWYIEKMRKLWGFHLIQEKNDEALKTIRIAEDRVRCCSELKTKALENSIKKFGIDYLFTGLRREEQGERESKDYFLGCGQHVKVNPVVHFTDKDIWDYIKEHNLPYCSLYDKGYRNIDCIQCTLPPRERLNESMEEKKDKKEVTEKLRRLGYF